MPCLNSPGGWTYDFKMESQAIPSEEYRGESYILSIFLSLWMSSNPWYPLDYKASFQTQLRSLMAVFVC